MPTPFFVVGASRSGTTMLRLMLNAHPRLAVPQELKYLNTLDGRVDLTRWDEPVEPEGRYRALVRLFLERRAHVFREIGPARLEREIMDDPERTLRAPYRLAAAAWARHHGKPRWGEKTPQNLFYADILADMFPGARFVYVARDPRAVVASMNRIAYFSGDTVLNALNVRRATTEGRAALCRAVPLARRLDVRYEDLVSEPERVLRRLCTFLDEPFEPGMVDFHRRAAAFMDPVIRTPAVTRPVDPARAATWQRTLSAAEVAVVERICHATMTAWGYEPTAPPLALPARLDRAAKSVYWSWMSLRHRHQRGYAVNHAVFSRTRARLRALLA